MKKLLDEKNIHVAFGVRRPLDEFIEPMKGFQPSASP
jgi:hypothetical protein